MIKPSKDGKQIWFLPPDKSKEEPMEFDLLHAVVCPKCMNLVQALFVTDKLINPKPWEEILTNQTDKDGKYKRIIPGRHINFKSRYEVTPIGRKSSISAELIKLKSHFETKKNDTNSSICNYIAIISKVPEYRIQDMLLSLSPPENPVKYNLDDTAYDYMKKELLDSYLGGDHYTFVNGVGDSPEAIFVSRDAQSWVLTVALGKYLKQFTQQVNKF